MSEGRTTASTIRRGALIGTAVILIGATAYLVREARRLPANPLEEGPLTDMAVRPAAPGFESDLSGPGDTTAATRPEGGTAPLPGQPTATRPPRIMPPTPYDKPEQSTKPLTWGIKNPPPPPDPFTPPPIKVAPDPGGRRGARAYKNPNPKTPLSERLGKEAP